MKQIDNYISEKLHLNRNTKIKDRLLKKILKMIGIENFNHSDALPKKINNWIHTEGIYDVTGYIDKKRYNLGDEYLDLFIDNPKKVEDALSFILNLKNSNEYYNLYNRPEIAEVTVMKNTSLVVSRRGKLIVLIEGVR